jgi:hypothetical protein
MAKAVEPPAPFVVLDSFVGQLDGVDVTYFQGEPVHPDDPAVRRWPHLFGPLVYPHPVKRASEPRIEQATAAPGEKRGA